MSDQLEATVASCVASLRAWRAEQQAAGVRISYIELMDHAWATWPDLPAAVIRIVVNEIARLP